MTSAAAMPDETRRFGGTHVGERRSLHAEEEASEQGQERARSRTRQLP